MSTSTVPGYPAEETNGYFTVIDFDCMIMEGSTATKLKVKRVNGLAFPNRIAFAFVDILPIHNIQEHQYTLGRILSDPPPTSRRQVPGGGTVITVTYSGLFVPNGFEWRKSWIWRNTNEAPATTPTVST